MWVIFLRAGAVLPFIAILGESGPLFEVRWEVFNTKKIKLTDLLTRTTQQANHTPSPSEWGMRVGAAYYSNRGAGEGEGEGL